MIKRIPFQGGQALFGKAEGALDSVLHGIAIPSAITPDAIPHLSAEHLVDGNTQRLALDIPQSHLDAANGRHLNRAASHILEVMKERLPMLLDLERILADKQFAKLFDHVRYGKRTDRGFTPAHQALVRLNLHVDVVSRVLRLTADACNGFY